MCVQTGGTDKGGGGACARSTEAENRFVVALRNFTLERGTIYEVSRAIYAASAWRPWWRFNLFQH